MPFAESPQFELLTHSDTARMVRVETQNIILEFDQPDLSLVDYLESQLEQIPTWDEVYRKTEIDQFFVDLVDGAPVTLDTLGKIATVTLQHGQQIQTLAADKADITYVDQEVQAVSDDLDAVSQVLSNDLDAVEATLNEKADTTYVNSQLALKADTTYVNSQLALKADTTYVNQQLALKANITYVDQQISDQGRTAEANAAVYTDEQVMWLLDEMTIMFDEATDSL